MESSNLLRNCIGMIIVFLQGMFICCIAYCLKSKYITLPKKAAEDNLDKIDNENEEKKKNTMIPDNSQLDDENNMSEIHVIRSISEDYSIAQLRKSEKSSPGSMSEKKHKCRRRLKLIIKDTIKEYKYEFFIRFGFNMYLDFCILSLLNISDFTFQNWVQIVSYISSVIVMVNKNKFYS